MKNPSENWESLRKEVLGLGINSVRKSHYPSLRQRLTELERFRSLVDISSDLLFVVECPTGRILDVSAASCDRLSITREGLLTSSFPDLACADAWQEILRLLEETECARNVATTLTTELTSSALQLHIPVEIAVQCIQIGDGVVAVLAARDVTERQKAQMRILKLNRLYAVITEVNKVIFKAQTREEMFQDICRVCIDCGHFNLSWIAIFDAAGGYVCPVASAGDEPLMAVTGCTPQTCVPCSGNVRRGEHFVCNELGMQSLCQAEALHRGYKSSCVVPLRFRSSVIGSLALYSSEPDFFDEEEIELLDGVALDISFALDALSRQEERSLAEQTLRETHRKVDAILRASPMAIVALDVNGHVTSWNRASEQLFGWGEQEVVGKANPVIPDGDVNSGEEILSRVISGEVYESLDLRCHRKDGSPVDVSFSAAPLQDDHEKTIGMMAIYADISERKQLQSMLQQAQKLESIGRLAGGVAHDFNNLLTVINGHGELLAQQMTGDNPLRRHVTEIRSAGLHAADLTSQLLAFSRKQVLQPQVLSINIVIAQMEDMLRRLIGEDVELVVTLSPAVKSVKADPGQLQQVVMNLVVNARDAVGTGGVITIRTGSSGADDPSADCVWFSVTDNGTGIDEETRKRIFEPFFTTKETGKGTGLGLSTVWGIVNQSGGHIKLESALNQGSTFTVYLPASGDLVASEEPAAASELLSGHETLLLVEDRDDVRHLTAEILKNSGYTVFEARTPHQAVEIWTSTRVSLIVTDVVMPEMTGPELAQELRRLGGNVKVLYISGHVSESILTPDSLKGDAAFLEKPFSVAQLTGAIRNLLINNEARTSNPPVWASPKPGRNPLPN